jgi:adenylylsulfate kinase-like enzyme
VLVHHDLAELLTPRTITIPGSSVQDQGARPTGVPPVLLDGDSLRSALAVTGSYDHESRRKLAFVYARLCGLIAGQGHTVICATIALFHDVQAWNRTHLPGYLEVFLDVPLDELYRRNSKGVYEDRSPVVGVGVPAQLPKAPDLAVKHTGATVPTEVASQIVTLYQQRKR